MISSVAEFARLASTASKERIGFEATQVTESNGLRIEAAVRRYGSRSIHIEYLVYQCSWTELEETLSGQVEFIGDELCGFVLHCEGQATWVYDPSIDTAIRKVGSQLFEPKHCSQQAFRWYRLRDPQRPRSSAPMRPSA